MLSYTNLSCEVPGRMLLHEDSFMRIVEGKAKGRREQPMSSRGTVVRPSKPVQVRS